MATGIQKAFLCKISGKLTKERETEISKVPILVLTSFTHSKSSIPILQLILSLQFCILFLEENS